MARARPSSESVQDLPSPRTTTLSRSPRVLSSRTAPPRDSRRRRRRNSPAAAAPATAAAAAKPLDDEKFGFTDFHRIDDIYSWLGRLAADHGPTASGRVPRALSAVGGHSYEGRLISGLALFPGGDKPRIMIEAGIHAQEWITTSSACWIIHHLLHGEDGPGQRLARRFEWHVFPNVNPDGYEYSFLKNRSWRKTRSKGLVCHGVDGNRNWECGWNSGNSATRHPCARNFPGRAPFCEVETRSLAQYVQGLLPRLKVYVSLHSSKQMVLFPWGCSKEPSPDHDELMEIGTKAANALEGVHGTKFVVGPISTTIYMAPGNSVDWAYSIGIKYAFAMELRNPVRSERYVRASAIVDTAEETFMGIITILEEVAARMDSLQAV